MTFDVFMSSTYLSLGQGLLYALVAIGIFLNLRVMKKPDLTVEGSFAFGAVIAITMLSQGSHFLVAILCAVLGGMGAGLVTGMLVTKLKLDNIVSGLIVTMALFSINFFVMDNSIISAPMETFIGFPFRIILDDWGLTPREGMLIANIIVGVIFISIIVIGLYLLFKTSFGLSVRATGSNENMARSNGINTDSRKIFTLMLSNGIVALAGALVAQMENGANLNIGVGVFVIGLAGLVIGEVLTPKKANILVKLLFIVLGSFIYFKVVSLIIITGLMSSEATSLLTAMLVLLALVIPKVKGIQIRRRK